MEIKSIKNTVVSVMVFMAMMLLANDTMAKCTKVHDSYEGGLGNVFVQDNVLVGDPLTVWLLFPRSGAGGNTQGWSCSRGDFFIPYLRGSAGKISTYQENGRSYSVYPTGVRGIGIILRTHTFDTYEEGVAKKHAEAVATDAVHSYYTLYKLIKTEQKIYYGPVSKVQVSDTWNITEGDEQFPVFLSAGTINICHIECKEAGDANQSAIPPPGAKGEQMAPFPKKRQIPPPAEDQEG